MFSHTALEVPSVIIHVTLHNYWCWHYHRKGHFQRGGGLLKAISHFNFTNWTKSFVIGNLDKTFIWSTKHWCILLHLGTSLVKRGYWKINSEMSRQVICDKSFEWWKNGPLDFSVSCPEVSKWPELSHRKLASSVIFWSALIKCIDGIGIDCLLPRNITGY